MHIREILSQLHRDHALPDYHDSREQVARTYRALERVDDYDAYEGSDIRSILDTLRMEGVLPPIGHRT